MLISVTSHAADASPAHFTAIGIASDGLHLLTGGFWIGGLVRAGALCCAPHEPASAGGATAMFAEWGMIAVALLVLTGMINAATILLGGEGHDTGALSGGAGRQAGAGAAMVGLALDNHFRLLPKLAAGGAAENLFRNIRCELGLGLIVVALAALLGLLPPTCNRWCRRLTGSCHRPVFPPLPGRNSWSPSRWTGNGRPIWKYRCPAASHRAWHGGSCAPPAAWRWPAPWRPPPNPDHRD